MSVYRVRVVPNRYIHAFWGHNTNLLHVPSFHSRPGLILEVVPLPVTESAPCVCVLRNLSVYLSYSAGGNIRVSSAAAAVAAAVDMNMLIGRRGDAGLRRN